MHSKGRVSSETHKKGTHRQSAHKSNKGAAEMSRRGIELTQ